MTRLRITITRAMGSALRIWHLPVNAWRQHIGRWYARGYLAGRRDVEAERERMLRTLEAVLPDCTLRQQIEEYTRAAEILTRAVPGRSTEIGGDR